MPAWAESHGGPLTDKQVDTLVNGVYKNWSKPASSSGPAPPSYSGDGSSGDAGRGKRLFAKDCYMCHGKGARVGPVTDVTYASLASDQYIRSTIIAGRSDLGMPNYRTLNLGKPLNEQDISDLVAYLASFRPADITATMQSGDVSKSGEQAGPSGSHEDENNTGQSGRLTKGNEGSGNGPGTPRPQQRGEGNKGKGSSSQRGVK
jgi:cytochrome c553